MLILGLFFFFFLCFIFISSFLYQILSKDYFTKLAIASSMKNFWDMECQFRSDFFISTLHYFNAKRVFIWNSCDKNQQKYEETSVINENYSILEFKQTEFEISLKVLFMNNQFSVTKFLNIVNAINSDIFYASLFFN